MWGLSPPLISGDDPPLDALDFLSACSPRTCTSSPSITPSFEDVEEMDECSLVSTVSGPGLLCNGEGLFEVMEPVEAGGEMREGDLMWGEVGEGELPPTAAAGGRVFSWSCSRLAASCLSLASSLAAALASLNFSTNCNNDWDRKKCIICITELHNLICTQCW